MGRGKKMSGAWVEPHLYRSQGQQLQKADGMQTVVYFLSHGPSETKEKNFVIKFTPYSVSLPKQTKPSIRSFCPKCWRSKHLGHVYIYFTQKMQYTSFEIKKCNSSQFEPVVSDIIVTAYTLPLRSSKYRNIVKVHCDQA